ncbi:MAG: formate/nitrite transporter family protein [Actinomyces sp.]|nr:MAG: formate/nitrite transporter family protein [Actinomyces sp.]
MDDDAVNPSAPRPMPDDSADGALPAAQYLPPERVLAEMAEANARRTRALSVWQIAVLSTMAGGFITVGALFSVLLAAGSHSEGVTRLLEGFGFSTGFFLVVLSGAVLFTEANVEVPATLLARDSRQVRSAVLRLWVLAAAGNLLGAFVVGRLVAYTMDYGPEYERVLGELVELKMRYRTIGGVDGVARAVVSGIVANWLVGMAAFLATMGRTIIGKYIPVLVVVSAFVAGGFLHSPANMAYFSLIQPLGDGPGWGAALAWGIAPAAVGNIIGAVVLVALPFWYGTGRTPRR